MEWNAFRIFWDQQITILWILLPPVFIFAGLLVLAGPILENRAQRREAGLTGREKADAAPLHEASAP